VRDVDPDGFGHEWSPWYSTTTTGPPAGTVQPAMWQAAIEVWHDE